MTTPLLIEHIELYRDRMGRQDEELRVESVATLNVLSMTWVCEYADRFRSSGANASIFRDAKSHGPEAL